MANEKKQYWAASDGSIVLFDYNDENDDVEDYIIENWGECEYGEFSSFTDLRNEEEEEWFNQQAFKGTSWNYVLDEAEKHFKCSLNSEMNNKERIIHDCLYKLWIKLKEEEEEVRDYGQEEEKDEEEEEEGFTQQTFEALSAAIVSEEEKESARVFLFGKEEERYCDNEKCPYKGYCFGEVKEQFEGKPYICEGCVTGKGLQEQEEVKRLANMPYYKRVRLGLR